ncbi:MAG TPA: 50S ribosomal protein L4 [Flavobacteriales bacterium]|nr:50S ribosomal protein L4 [Flavobacteriales bacterium]
MEAAVLNIQGKETGRKVKLSDGIFGIEPNDHAIYLDVKQILANRRQGTHKIKQRAEVAGSTRKLHRQKGTGGSRKGSIKNPLYKQGGTMHGPEPRDYGFKLNKKVKKLARRSALSHKAKAKGLLIVEDIQLKANKTKEFAAVLKNLKAEGRNSLVVVSAHNEQLYLASRNIEKTNLIVASQLNTYDIMRAHNLILTEGSVAEIEKLFNNNN